MSRNGQNYKELLEELDSKTHYMDEEIQYADNNKTFQSVLLKDVLKTIENGDIIPYTDFKELPLELQAKTFLLIDKEFQTSQIATKWRISENTVYQWRHRIKKFVHESTDEYVTHLKREISLLKHNAVKNKDITMNQQVNPSLRIEYTKNDPPQNEKTSTTEDIVIKQSEDAGIEFNLKACPSYLLKNFLEYILKEKSLAENKTYEVSITIKEN